jgi:hypothetical protein
MPKDQKMLGPSEHDTIRLTFGQVESRLARMHEIASDKRTQFQARLRNFQRLRARPIPLGVNAGRGKTVLYTPGQVVEVALALELTQLGLLPERVEDVFRFNRFPIFMAVQRAVAQLQEKGGFRPDRERADENMTINTGPWWATGNEEDDPLSWFLFFDASTLNSLTKYADDEDAASASFFYGDARVVRRNIVRWTAGPYIRRLSLINVTAMLWSLIQRSKPEGQKLFLDEVIEWCDSLEEQYFAESVGNSDEDQESLAGVVAGIETYEDVVKHANIVRQMRGNPPMIQEALIKLAQNKVDEKRGHETLVVPEHLQPPLLTPDMTNAQIEDQLVKGMRRGGLPEFVARGLVDEGRPDRERRMAQIARKRSAKEADDGNGE